MKRDNTVIVNPAVNQTSANVGSGKRSASSAYYYKLFRVKRSCGKVTTVSVDPILVTRACQIMGGLTPVSKLVREAAAAYNPEEAKNCSGYVTEQLRKAMVEHARKSNA